ncbi:hypothetical protein D3C78_1262580 [compost metagenome]
MNVAMGGGEDEARRTEPERFHLRRDRLAVIDDVMRAEFFHPGNRFRPRSGGDDGEVGQRPQELDGDGADATSAADDQNGVGRARNRFLHPQPVEQRLISGDRGQRQGGRFLEIQ